MVGDPLCAVAGWLKLPFWPCVVYMAIGKFARYVTMTVALLYIWPQLRRRAQLQQAVGAAALQRTLVGRPRMDALEVGHQLGPRGIEPAARPRGFDRKAHLDVGAGERIAGKPFALAEFAFHEVEVAS